MPATNVIVRISENANTKALSENLFSNPYRFSRLFDIAEQVEAYHSQNPEKAAEFIDAEELFDIRIIQQLPEEEANLYRTYVVETGSPEEAALLVSSLNESGQVDFAEIDQEHVPYMPVPNDPNYSEQWSLSKIQVEEVWEQTTGAGIVVAVVDSGVDYNHPEINANMWKHPKGHYGYDFVNNTTNPMDLWNHGTFVAGVIAAVTNNNQQIAGVAYNAKIMAVKIYTNATSGIKDSIAAKGIKYAVDNGAKIINNSWGPAKRQATTSVMNQVLLYAYSRGVIVVFGAGNSKDDVQYYGPTNHPFAIAVAATTKDDKREEGSNYGARITIAAPGEEILSIKPGASTPTKGWGTSAAAPVVSGAIALLKRLNPRTTTPDTVKARLKATGDIITTDKPIGKRLNVKKLVTKDPEDLLRIEQQVPFNYSGVTGCAKREPDETKKVIKNWINGIKAKYPDYNVLEFGKLWSTATTKTKKEGFPSNKRSCKTSVNMRCYVLLKHK